MIYSAIIFYTFMIAIIVVGAWGMYRIWKFYHTQMRKIDEEVQFLHDVIHSNEGKQVLHLKYGRRKGDTL